MSEIYNEEIKLIALDLDGTLFNSDKKISEKNREAVSRAAKKGIIVVPATGRPFYGISEQVLSLAGIEYILTTNGAAVYRLSDERCMFEEPMDTERFLEFLRRAKEYFISCEVFIDGKAYTDEDSVKVWDKMKLGKPMMEYIRSTRIVEDNLEKFIRCNNKKVQKITMNFATADDGSKLYRSDIIKLAEEFDDFVWVSGGMGNVELTRRGISKGSGLMGLADMLGIDRKNIMACGDSGNDKEMIIAAGLGVAMSNAEPEILECADYITLSNDEDGVAAVIEKFCM